MQVEKVYLKIKKDAIFYGSELQSARGKIYPFTVNKDLYILSSEDSGFENTYTLLAESLELDTNDAPISVVNRGWRDAWGDENYVGYDYSLDLEDMVQNSRYDESNNLYEDDIEKMRNTIIYLGLLHLAEDGEL